MLGALPDEQLSLTVGKNMGTLGAQFRHIAEVEFQYSEAIESGILTALKEKVDKNTAGSTEALRSLLERSHMALKKGLETVNDDQIVDWEYWGEGKISLEMHIHYLTDHEILHHGELVVYFKTHSISFPKSWAAWGL